MRRWRHEEEEDGKKRLGRSAFSDEENGKPEKESNCRIGKVFKFKPKRIQKF